MTTNTLDALRPADVIRARLAQYLGPFTSKNAVQMMSRQALAVDADSLTRSQVPTLMEALGPTLRTLLGKDGAARVAEEIRKELGLQ